MYLVIFLLEVNFKKTLLVKYSDASFVGRGLLRVVAPIICTIHF